MIAAHFLFILSNWKYLILPCCPRQTIGRSSFCPWFEPSSFLQSFLPCSSFSWSGLHCSYWLDSCWTSQRGQLEQLPQACSTGSPLQIIGSNTLSNLPVWISFGSNAVFIFFPPSEPRWSPHCTFSFHYLFSITNLLLLPFYLPLPVDGGFVRIFQPIKLGYHFLSNFCSLCKLLSPRLF